jgi:hypothetical protein
MALNRLASALLVSTLVAGCSQSLFDANLGGDGTGDGGNQVPDARTGGRDAGDDERDGGDGERDGAPGGPDARVVDAAVSPAPEFVEIYEGPDGFDEIPMQEGTWNGLDAWVTTDADTEAVRSAVVNCPVASDSRYCLGLPVGALLFVSTNDTHRPAVRWESPFSQVLVDFQWLVHESALATPATLRIQQNGLTIETRELEVPDQSDQALYPVDVAPGDVLVVLPAVGDPTGGQIGMRVNFTERRTPLRSLR